jgi:hypothetical protein
VQSVTSRSVAEDEDSDADVDLPNLLLSLSSGILSGANAEVPTPNTNISFDHPPVSPDSDSMDSDNSYQRCALSSLWLLDLVIDSLVTTESLAHPLL